MKTIWNILSVLAVANMLAILGFVGWLASSQRLSMDRVRGIREVLVETLPVEAERKKEEEKKAEEAKVATEAAVKAARPPMTAAEKVATRIEATELDMQRYKKLQSDIEAIQTSLRAQQEQLAADRRALDEDRKRFEKLKADTAERELSAQFKKTLAAFEAMEVKAAVATLKEILSPMGAKTAESQQLAVGYLNAMSASKRNDILGNLGKTEPNLAAELLEALRKFGVPDKPAAPAGQAAPSAGKTQ